ncbi:MAG: hypothetical protein MPJ50_10020 [Pirellulales bacterium]|nr:hypothetical protein [Pirellulales bacterium]
MRRFHVLSTSVVTLAVLVGLTDSALSGPLRNLFRRIDADPSKEYALQPDHGPWMIMAATFAGQGAYDQARELVLELRSKYKLEAFQYRMRFDYDKDGALGLEVDRNGIPLRKAQRVDRFGNPLKMQTLRDEMEEWAVMVGNYQKVDEADAQRALYTIKDAEPDALNITKIREAGKQRTYQVLAGFRLMSKYNAQKKMNDMQQKIAELSRNPRIKIRSETQKWGPMGSAFLTRNPLRRDDEEKSSTVDKFVYEMNKGVDLSLLKNSGKYTVKVATFVGGTIVDQRKIDDYLRGVDQAVTTRLEKAAIKAHELTVALRAKGVEAYEFHDRKASIVCVGGFSNLGTQLPDGRIQLSHEIQRTVDMFAPQANGQPQTLIGIPFDVTPTIVHVPRRSIGSDYATSW